MSDFSLRKERMIFMEKIRSATVDLRPRSLKEQEIAFPEQPVEVLELSDEELSMVAGTGAYQGVGWRRRRQRRRRNGGNWRRGR